MSTLDATQRKNLELAYKNHAELIKERQQFEAAHDEKPYNQLKTTIDFPNAQGMSLIHIAAKLGDLDKVKELIKEGASLSCKTYPTKITPLQFAFMFENTELIHYLLNDQKININTILRSYIDNPKLQSLYDKHVRESILKRLNPKSSIFYKPYNPDPFSRGYLHYAAEIGDSEYIEKTFQYETEMNAPSSSSYNFFASTLPKLKDQISADKDIDNPLITAVLNKQHDALKVLLKYLNPNLVPINKTFYTSALHYAAMMGDWESAHLLIQAGANINLQDEMGKSPLFYAIQNGEESFAKNLIEQKADLNALTFYEESLLHAAQYGNCTTQFKNDLAEKITNKSLISHKNIFGRAPEEIQDQAKNTSQNRIIDRLDYFHTLNYRHREYFSPKGYCNGLVFIKQYFHSRGKIEFYNSLVNTILDWKGTSAELDKSPPSPLSANFKTVKEMFDTFINWLTWYQHGDPLDKETGIRQTDRNKQFEGEVNHFIRDIPFSKINKEQLNEIISIISFMPINTRIENGGAFHAITYTLLKDRKFYFDDPNLKATLKINPDSEQLSDIILVTKYKTIHGQHIVSDISFSIYCFPWDNIDVHHFNYFAPQNLPTSKDAVNQYVNHSPNRFTQLHVAALTHSIQNVKDILKDSSCDINAKDADGKSAFNIAIYTGDIAFCKLFLDDPNLDLQNPEALINAYMDGLYDIANLILDHPNCKNVTRMFALALLEKDYSLIEKIFLTNKIDSSFWTILFERKDYSAIIYCLERNNIFKDMKYTDQQITNLIDHLLTADTPQHIRENKYKVIERILHPRQVIDFYEQLLV